MSTRTSNRKSKVDELETRLRAAAGKPPFVGQRCIEESRSFIAGLGCGCSVQINHIDGNPVGHVGLQIRHLTADAAEAVLQFLRQRNEPNSSFSRGVS